MERIEILPRHWLFHMEEVTMALFGCAVCYYLYTFKHCHVKLFSLGTGHSWDIWPTGNCQKNQIPQIPQIQVWTIQTALSVWIR